MIEMASWGGAELKNLQFLVPKVNYFTKKKVKWFVKKTQIISEIKFSCINVI